MKFIDANWGVPKHVKALTTTRIGGVSENKYTSLNVGNHVSDEHENVQQNRQLLKNELQLSAEPSWLNQQHTINVVDGIELRNGNTNQACDGIYTNEPNIVCAIMTADCLPLFICNQSGTEIALLHVGWRGLADGIIEQGLRKFKAPANELIAWAGPAISQKHFEIGAECKQLLGGSEKYYRSSERVGYYYADLYGLVGEHLTNLDITYTHSQYCTYDDDELFYSYRRDGISGRMVSLLWLDY